MLYTGYTIVYGTNEVHRINIKSINYNGIYVIPPLEQTP